MSEIITTVAGTSAAIIPGDGQTHYDFGILDERDRIVALLERSAEERGQCCQGHASERQLILDQVKLIRGADK
jgi:hypothetical protein